MGQYKLDYYDESAGTITVLGSYDTVAEAHDAALTHYNTGREYPVTSLAWKNHCENIYKYAPHKHVWRLRGDLGAWDYMINRPGL